jgi:hypothetical protein
MIELPIKTAPRDVARLQALLEGHDGLGALSPIDAQRGVFALIVAPERVFEAREALQAAATRVPLRFLDEAPSPPGPRAP